MKNGQITSVRRDSESQSYGLCCKPLTKRQKNCSITVITIAIFIVILGLFYLGFRAEIEVCTTPSCVRSATEFLSHIDTKADPCEDFYRFSCGNFLQNTNLDNRGSRSVQDVMEDEIQSEIRNMLELPIHTEDPRSLNIAKKFYRACMNESAIEEEGLKKIKQIFVRLGGWPTLQGNNWREDQFDWMDAVHKLRKLGVNSHVFFRVSVDRDEGDDSRYVLGIHETSYSPSSLSSELESSYLNYMVRIAVHFGASHTTAKRDSNEVLRLFLELAKISEESARSNRTTNERLSLSELQYEYRNIQWYYFLSGIINPTATISYDDDVVVTAPVYLKRIDILLTKTSKRILANFVVWHTLQYLINFLPSEILSEAYDFLEKINKRMMRPSTPRWKVCLEVVEDRMGPVISASYMQNFFPEDDRYQIVEMIRKIKIQFQSNLLKLEWIDKETKVLILEQLHASTEEIPSYGDLLNMLDKNKIYDEAKVNESKYLESALNLNLINMNHNYDLLRTTVEDEWFMDSEFIKGFVIKYSPKKNTLTFPIGIFRGIYYRPDRPEYMNYGSLGTVISHEISHIFVEAEYGNFPGELRSWWSPNSLLNYDEKLQCLSNQYGNFAIPELFGKQLNPKKTRDEDMADLAGMKISYDTYINRVQENGPEPLLPGLKYSPNQLFWIASAIRHCSKYSIEDLERYIDNYRWSPQQFRVNGPLQNLKEFAFDFGCRRGSTMNPENKCDIW
nr:neprilysin-2-like [Leptinotarsa decemlineata]